MLYRAGCFVPRSPPGQGWGCQSCTADAALCPLQVCRALEEATTPALHLQALPSPWPCISAYAQGNTLASRKKVLPILRAALGGGPGTAAGPEEEAAPPPTPMNSLVEESPLAQAVPPVCPQAVLERVSRMAAEQPDSDK